MTGFSAEWLALREPYDLSARNPAVLEAVASALKSHSSMRVVDLAAGAGSTLRALGPHLPSRQNWKLIDNDPGLLTRAMATPLAEGVTVAAIPLDLNLDLQAALDTLSLRLTLRLGVMLAAGLATLAAIIKL